MGLFRAMQRNASVRQPKRVFDLAAGVPGGTVESEAGKAALMRTREQVVAGWLAVSERLRAEGDSRLAGRVWSFVARMAPVRSEKETVVKVTRFAGRGGEIDPLERTR